MKEYQKGIGLKKVKKSEKVRVDIGLKVEYTGIDRKAWLFYYDCQAG